MGAGRRSSTQVPRKETRVTGRTQVPTGTSSQPLEPDMPARIYELLQELHGEFQELQVELDRHFQTMKRRIDSLEYGLTLLMDESQRQQYQMFKRQQLMDNNMEDNEGGEDEDQQEHHNEIPPKEQNGGNEHERRTKARHS